MNLIRNHEVVGLVSGITQWVKDLALTGAVVYVGHRHSSDPPLLWLWCRLADAAPIRPLSWEFSYAAGATLKRKKKKKKSDSETE